MPLAPFWVIDALTAHLLARGRGQIIAVSSGIDLLPSRSCPSPTLSEHGYASSTEAAIMYVDPFLIPSTSAHLFRCGVGMSLRQPEALDECGVKLIDPEKVNRVRELLRDQGEVIELADVFSLLADPGRLRLLVALLEAGELCVCDLAATTEMTESAVSHALRLLRAHRVVSVSRRGRMAYYRLDDAHVRMLLDLDLTHAGHTTAIHPER